MTMKNVVFVTSHLGSDSIALIHALNKNDRVKIRGSNISYHHPRDLRIIFRMGHTNDTSAAIYGDHLLFNNSLSNKCFYNFSKFIYVIRSAKPSINKIVRDQKYGIEGACNYYRYRMRRICEMAKATPSALLLTWESMHSGSCLNAVEEFLDLNVSLPPLELSVSEDSLDSRYLTQSEESYERHLYYLKSLPLKKVLT